MLRVALWNTNRRPVAGLLATLIHTSRPNLLILLESADSIASILDAIGDRTGAPWYPTWSACERVTILTAFPSSFIKVTAESNYHTARRITLPGLPEVILVAAHLRSQLNQSQKSAVFQTQTLVESVAAVEAAAGHQRTVLAGDFNMDPYDDGMVAARTVHGMMTRRRAQQRSRIVEGRSYSMFYNPMWGLFGDNSSGPPGTYRYWRAEHVMQEWHIFDQVLIRPDLLPYFPHERLVILSAIGSRSLLSSSGVPTPSDHLPVLFSITEPGAIK